MILRISIIISLLLVFASTSKSQVADFTIIAPAPCELIYQFNDNSTGTGLSYAWDFDNGQNSTLQNPVITFGGSGTYNISLTVTDGTNSDTHNETIVIYEKPNASFALSSAGSGCVPLDASFTDLSTQGDATITTWQWVFGDGNAGASPIHQYINSGVFDVSLHITDGNGCVSDTTIAGLISVSTMPVISIDADITQYCSVPVDINFTNNSTGSTTINDFAWTFGDGNSSTSENPTNQYTSLGVYDVSLTVTDVNGCSNDSVFANFININSVTASFDINPVATIYCTGTPVQFTNTSGINGNWLFGDGSGLNNSGSSPVSHSYNNAGTYTVQLIAAPGDICADTITQTIEVEAVNANFSTSPSFGCEDGLDVTFTDASSSNVVSWEWNFGDGSSNSTNAPPVNHTYNGEGSYTNTLTVTTANGCTATYVLTNNITIEYPVADFVINYPPQVCAPVDITFTDNSTSSGVITNYDWTFDNGTPAAGTGTPISSAFSTAGEWAVELTITNDAGCVASFLDTVYVGSHQTPNFVALKDTVCASDSISFDNLSVDSNIIDNYNWQFSTDFEPLDLGVYTNNVYTDTGDAIITLITDYNGCKDTLIDSTAFYVKGPIVRNISFTKDCANPYVATLTADILAGEYWTWNFGDGTVINNSTDLIVVHTYAARGDYWVSVNAFNPTEGCDFKDSIQIKITDIKADSTFAPSLNCTGTIVDFNASGSQDAVSYYFGFGDGNNIGPTIYDTTSYNYLSSGIYYDTLMVWDMYGCVDTITDTLFSSLPVAVIYTDTTYGCSPLDVQFYGDSSNSDFIIDTYVWSFNPSNNVANLSSTFINPSPSVNHFQPYNVSLTVYDTLGCSSTENILIKSFAVNANIIDFDTTICANQQISLFADSTNYYFYNWNCDNGTTSNQSSLNTIYTNDTTFNIGLIITDTLGCADTTNQNVYVQDINVELSFLSTLDTTIQCYVLTPLDTNFYQNNTSDEYFTTWNWNLGGGVNSTVQYPYHLYTYPGIYNVTLEATTSYGCSDIDSIIVDAFGPYATIDIDKDTICKGESFTINLNDTLNIMSLLGTFGDGSGMNSIPYIYEYLGVGEQTINITVYSDANNQCKIELDTSIFVREVIADFFIYNNTGGNIDTANCSPFEVGLNNNSQGASNWQWNYGDGTTYTGQVPDSNIYVNLSPNNIIYDIQLIVNDNIGCTDTLLQQITVYGTPPIEISKDTLICRGNNLSLNVSGGNQIAWSPNKWLNDTSLFSIITGADSTIMYFAEISDSRGCTNLDSITVSVQQVPAVNYSSDTSIIIGEYAPLYIYADQENVSYIWSPDYTITCLDCEDVSTKPLINTTYQIVYEDSTGRCFLDSVDIKVTVIEEYSIDVPTAFTPNGDGANDIVYVRGWGIKDLLEFSIYNRWGELVYFTDDLKQGWDGTFKSKPQNIDSYVYYAKVSLYSGKILTKKGTINLLR